MSDLKAAALRALKLMDLTTLNDDDTDAKVISLCHDAKTAVATQLQSVFTLALFLLLRRHFVSKVRQKFALQQ